MDYKLIYEVKKANLNTQCKSNLRIQYENKAREEADKIHQQYLDFLNVKLGHNRIEVTNTACMANGIISHVYTWDEGITKPKDGLGKKKCIFCGCDDFDF